MTVAGLIIRDAAPSDVPAILHLIRELAIFERAEDQVVATEADLLRDGFGPERRFQCRLAVLDGQACGFTLWFHNYSTWLGRAGIYLEDLYVAEAMRRRGIGQELLFDIARLAVEKGAGRLDLNVLSWNPARAFYESLGIRHLHEWLPYRVTGEALLTLSRVDRH